MKEVKRVANEYRIKNYGNLIMSNSPEFDQDRGGWSVTLKSVYPRIIVDDGDPPVRELYTITLENLGKLEINKNKQVVEATPREVVVDRLEKYLSAWRRRVENAIIKASSSNLVFSPTIQYFMNPLKRIMSTVLLTGDITNAEISYFRKKERIYEWIELLENEQILEEYEEGYRYGELWTGLYESASGLIKDDYEDFEYDAIIYARDFMDMIKSNLLYHDTKTVFQHLVMPYILQKYFEYIKDVLNLRSIGRIVNVNNTFYAPCIEAEKLLTFTPRTILRNYNKNYPRIEFPLISSIVMELIDIGLFRLEDGKIHGNRERFDAMMEYEPSKQIPISI